MFDPRSSSRKAPVVNAALLCVLTALLISATVVGQSQEDWSAAKGEQRYHGVTPGSGNSLPRVEELTKKNGFWATWPGFQMTENGGSRLFVQTTGELDYKLEENARAIRLVLKNTKIFLSNNRNPLVTDYFNTPVSRARLKRVGKNAVLIIDLKVEAAAKVSQSVDADGYHYLFVEFAPGEYPVGAPSSASAS